MKHRRPNPSPFPIVPMLLGGAAIAGIVYVVTRPSVPVPTPPDHSYVPIGGGLVTGPLSGSEVDAIQQARLAAARAQGLSPEQMAAALAQGRALGLDDPTLRTNSQVLLVDQQFR